MSHYNFLKLFVIEDGFTTEPHKECQVESEWQDKGDPEAECSARERRGVSRNTKFQKSRFTKIKGEAASRRKEGVSSVKFSKTGQENG